jgi:short-subunit dehydrogenase
MRISGSHALITGASRGIGLEIARRMAERGARLSVLSSNAESIGRVADALGANPIAADLSDLGAVAGVLPAAVEANGPVEILVNNAAKMGMGPVARLDAETLRATLTVNLLAPAELARGASGPMIERGAGAIVSVSSLAGEMALRNVPAYGSSKAGLSYLTRTMQRELRGTGVQVQLVVLGGVDTELFRENVSDPVAGPSSKRLQSVVPVPPAEVVGEQIVAWIESGRRRPLVLPPPAMGLLALRNFPSVLTDLLLRGMPRSV